MLPANSVRIIRLSGSYLGKPYPAIFEYTFSLLSERFKLPLDTPKKQVIMFGDSLRSDILGANKVGFTSALMLTGITNLNQAEDAGKQLKPDYVFKSFS